MVGEIIYACIRTAEQFNIGWRGLRRMRFKVQLKSSIVARGNMQNEFSELLQALLKRGKK